MKLGAVIEIETPQGLAYAQYCQQNEMYGPLLRVLPGLHQSRAADIERVVQQPERFFTFYPLKPAVRQGLVSVVSTEAIPEHAQEFPLMRVAGARDQSGAVLDWWLFDGEREWRIEGELTEEQKELSIAAVWTHPTLVDRIASGWSPAEQT